MQTEGFIPTHTLFCPRPTFKDTNELRVTGRRFVLKKDLVLST
jgi:hypothetical protein